MPNNKDINKHFSKYKLSKKKESMNDICQPRSFKLQPQQNFLSDYFKSKYANKGLLVYHKIGAGKTCTAISIAEEFKNKKKIIVVLPASLIGNFRDELRSQCGGNQYMTDKERQELTTLKPRSTKFRQIIKTTNKRIDKYYNIYSYHIFIDLCEQGKVKLKNTLLIIDEIQNMVSETGYFYQNLKRVIDKSDDKTRIVLLSATPMFDKPVEIALTLNLLKLKTPLPIGSEFNQMFIKQTKNPKNNKITYEMKNMQKFKSLIPNLISYYRGAQPQAFPKQIFKTINCKMEHFQYKSYLTSLSTEEEYIKGSFTKADILQLPNSFMLGPRLISNVAFPNKGIGGKGFSSFKGSVLSNINIKKYSKKFYKINNKVCQSSGPVFIYSNFKDYGGIKSLIAFLEYQGYKNYSTFGEGKKRFAVWSSDESSFLKDEIKYTFNQPSNVDGSKIKILLGTPAVKEGISLLRVEQVHIMEPYWNMSRIKQIIGRSVRYCSHKDLPVADRYVEVYLYLATYPGIKTVDQTIWAMAKKKNLLISQFEKSLKEAAIDCKLFYNRNVYKNDEPLKCLE